MLKKCKISCFKIKFCGEYGCHLILSRLPVPWSFSMLPFRSWSWSTSWSRSSWPSSKIQKSNTINLGVEWGDLNTIHVHWLNVFECTTATSPQKWGSIAPAASPFLAATHRRNAVIYPRLYVDLCASISPRCAATSPRDEMTLQMQQIPSSVTSPLCIRKTPSVQGYNARKVNCSCAYTAYILKPVLSIKEFVNKKICSVSLLSEEDKSI